MALEHDLEEKFNKVLEEFNEQKEFTTDQKEKTTKKQLSIRFSASIKKCVSKKFKQERSLFTQWQALAPLPERFATCITEEQQASWCLGKMLSKKYNSSDRDIFIHYLQIYNADTQNHLQRCPVCGQILETKHKETGTLPYVELDHLLPKSIYPQFALSLENLIPICHECNHAKSDKFGDFKDLSEFREALDETYLKMKDSKEQKIAKQITYYNLYQHLRINSDFWGKYSDYCAQKKEDPDKPPIFQDIPTKDAFYAWLKVYDLPKRMERIAHNCMESLLQQLRQAELKGPDGVWQHLEYLALANQEEFKTGSPTHPYIQVWQDLLDWVLSDTDHVTVLWEELSDRSLLYRR